jgi:succinyl-CoA synthetase alpha subunit
MKLDNISKILVQGITTTQGAHYTELMLQKGTPIVAGIGKLGETALGKIPIYNLVEQAISFAGQIDISLIFVEGRYVLDAALEAMANEIKRIIIFSTGITPQDILQVIRTAKRKGVEILGPGSLGVLIPNRLYLGTQQYQFYSSGNIGVISRLDRLMDQVANILTQNKIGQSFSGCLGSERILGSSFEKWLNFLEHDPKTEAILLLGRAYGEEEIRALQYIENNLQKPTIIYLAGLELPPKRKLWSQTSSYVLDSSHFYINQNLWLDKLTTTTIPILQSLNDIPEFLLKELSS